MNETLKITFYYLGIITFLFFIALIFGALHSSPLLIAWGTAGMFVCTFIWGFVLCKKFVLKIFRQIRENLHSKTNNAKVSGRRAACPLLSMFLRREYERRERKNQR